MWSSFSINSQNGEYMTAHQLAQELLSYPDFIVMTYDPYTENYEEIDTFVVDQDEEDITFYSNAVDDKIGN